MLSIVTIPTSTLRERSREVLIDELASEDMQAFIAELTPKMYELDGIGIASTQVGNNIRVCVIGKDAIPKRHALAGKDLILVNPEYERTGKKTITETEGCLSVPGSYGPVRRYRDLRVTALNPQGEQFTFDARGFFARVIQHEIDHLNGILYIDRADQLHPSEHKDAIDFDIIKDNVKSV